MRTTITIDDDLLREAKVLAARTHGTVSSVLEDALREHLSRARVTAAEPYVPPTFPGDALLVDILDKEDPADARGDNDTPP